MGVCVYEVLAGFVEHEVTACIYIAREHWDHDVAGRHTWLRAQQLICDMADNCIDPVAQQMEPPVQHAMATLGPTQGPPCFSDSIDAQVCGALPSRGIAADACHSNCITDLVSSVRSQACHGCCMTVLDTSVAQYDVCHKLHAYLCRGIFGRTSSCG